MAKKAKRAAPKQAKKAAKRPAARTAAKPTKRAAPKPAKPTGIAAKMAAFSKEVLKEEEEPVAVRSFIEARQGIDASKELDVKSGVAKPVPGVKPLSPPMAKPQMEPLTGPLAVPKQKTEEFTVGASAKKGKKGAPPTKDEFGRIELRMQRGTTDEKIADASPDYLQRSFNKAAQEGKVSATKAVRKDADDDVREFRVKDEGGPAIDPALMDFGEVEIAQQTRRGSRKLGKLDDEEEKDN